MTNKDGYTIAPKDFDVEPIIRCKACGAELRTDWVDIGFGPYSSQASPYVCECGWSETRCVECIPEKCHSWSKCKGLAARKLNRYKIRWGFD